MWSRNGTPVCDLVAAAAVDAERERRSSVSLVRRVTIGACARRAASARADPARTRPRQRPRPRRCSSSSSSVLLRHAIVAEPVADRERRAPSRPSSRASRITAGPSRRSVRGLGLDDARALDEIVDAERRGEARRAAGRQHVIRPGEIVAERLGRVLARGRSRPRGGRVASQRCGSPHQRARGARARCGWRSRSPRRRVARDERPCRSAASARRGDRPPRQSSRAARRAPPRRARASARGRASRRPRPRAGRARPARACRRRRRPASARAVGDDQHLARAGDHVDVDARRSRAASRSRRRCFPGRRSCRRAGSCSVPYASAATACAPPTRKSASMPAMCAAASITGVLAGRRRRRDADHLADAGDLAPG